jgi:hypothetical protein
MKKKTALNLLLVHLLVWLTWLFLQSLSLFETWHLSDKNILAYNYLSLVLLFYSVHYLAGKYFRQLSYSAFRVMNNRQKAGYLLLRRQVPAISFIILLYAIGSWFVDSYIFNLKYPYFFLYCSGRWNVEAFYVLTGIGLSCFFEYAKRKNLKIQEKEERIINLGEPCAAACNLPQVSKGVATCRPVGGSYRDVYNVPLQG